MSKISSPTEPSQLSTEENLDVLLTYVHSRDLIRQLHKALLSGTEQERDALVAPIGEYISSGKAAEAEHRLASLTDEQWEPLRGFLTEQIVGWKRKEIMDLMDRTDPEGSDPALCPRDRYRTSSKIFVDPIIDEIRNTSQMSLSDRRKKWAKSLVLIPRQTPDPELSGGGTITGPQQAVNVRAY